MRIYWNRNEVICVTVLTEEKWRETMAANNWNPIMLRDERYDQIIHMVSVQVTWHVVTWYVVTWQVTAAKGAEKFYQVANNAVRSEGIEEAVYRDSRAAQVGVVMGGCGPERLWYWAQLSPSYVLAQPLTKNIITLIMKICGFQRNCLYSNLVDALFSWILIHNSFFSLSLLTILYSLYRPGPAILIATQ